MDTCCGSSSCSIWTFSAFVPKRRKIKTLVRRRQKVIRRVIPFPSVLEPIPKEVEEEDDEDEEDNLPLS